MLSNFNKIVIRVKGR